MRPYRTFIKRSRLYPVLWLEEVISHQTRRVLIRVSQIILLFFLLAVALDFFSRSLPWLLVKIMGASLFYLGLSLAIYLLDLYFRSYYFGSIVTNDYRPEDLCTFTVGRILFKTRGDDLTVGFLRSRTGGKIAARLGLTGDEVAKFLQMRRDCSRLPLPFTAGQVIKVHDLVAALLAANQQLTDWLLRRDLRQEEFLAATDWVVRQIEREAAAERWWSHERLERVAGLAKDWSYGGTYRLDRYSRDLLLAEEAGSLERGTISRGVEVRQIETILTRSREANALVVAPVGETKMNIIWQLAQELKSGRIVPALEDKRLVLLQTSLLLAAFKERAAFEQEVVKIFNEAVRAGNIILVFDNLPVFLRGAEHLGVDLIALLDPYLAKNSLPIIALADLDTFQRELEGRAALLGRWEKVLVTEIDENRLLTTLEETAERHEQIAGVWFTYPAIAELAASAGRYFQTETVADQALDLLTELVPWSRGRGRTVIDKAAVQTFVRQKTGIPLGRLSPEERERLVHLPEALRARVIGQTATLDALANALKRSRSDIRNPKRPIGSFLFLGPTGVGKTETAKALAASFFGREEVLLRLDMSEYQGSDALSRLIGFAGAGQPGHLANLLRQRPYGVLLLDEFEKTTLEVRNLFLQILDEGFFSDMSGERVNARNVIFLATSNAGAPLIWEMVKGGRDPAAARDELIDHLVKTGIFSPELLNRFDDLIIFHPLSAGELKQVASLLLERLRARLRERGYELTFDEPVTARVATEGSDQLFGARPMQRFIQNRLEQPIADAVVAGRVPAGARLSFDAGLNLQIATPQ